MRTRGLLAALVVPLLVLSACGEQGSSTADDPTPSASAKATAKTASTSPSATSSGSASASATPVPKGPACAEVWHDGAPLARTYTGCVAHHTWVAAKDRPCEFGKRLVTYADRFYAVRTGTIHRTHGPLDKDRGYRVASASCSG